jgi:hypothetical protein
MANTQPVLIRTKSPDPNLVSYDNFDLHRRSFRLT